VEIVDAGCPVVLHVPAEGGEAHPHIQPGNLKITQEIMSRCFFGLTT